MTTLGVDSEFRQLPPIYGWRIPPQEEEALRISYWILLDILAWSTAKQDIGFLYLTTLTALSPAEKYWTVPPSAFYDDCEQKIVLTLKLIYFMLLAWLLQEHIDIFSYGLVDTWTEKSLLFMINHELTDLLIIEITCCLATNDEQREATTVGHAVAPGPNHSRMGKSCRTANNRRRSCPSWVPPQLFKQEVNVSRSQGQQLSMYLFEGGRGAVASTSAAPEQNE